MTEFSDVPEDMQNLPKPEDFWDDPEVVFRIDESGVHIYQSELKDIDGFGINEEFNQKIHQARQGVKDRAKAEYGDLAILGRVFGPSRLTGQESGYVDFGLEDVADLLATYDNRVKSFLSDAESAEADEERSAVEKAETIQFIHKEVAKDFIIRSRLQHIIPPHTQQ